MYQLYHRWAFLAITPGALLLSRQDVARHLDADTCITAVEAAFLAHGRNLVPPPAVLGMRADHGGFHVKAGVFGEAPRYFAAKLNANFMENRQHGLPTIQGVVLLCEAETGMLLAVMDTIEITAMRTGAATAVAARHLARSDSHVVAVCGCGTQGRAQLRALARVLPLQRALVYDALGSSAEGLAGELQPEVGFPIEIVDRFETAVRACDVCVTCTPARAPVLEAEWVRPGTFVAGVGADAEYKQELPPDLFRGALVVADVVSQCSAMGDLHHALAAGALTGSEIHAELGEVVAGLKPGRTGPEQITVFDSTGMAIQDVAAAAVVYRRCLEQGGAGLPRFAFNS